MSSDGPLAKGESPRSDKNVMRKVEQVERSGFGLVFPLGTHSERHQAPWAARL